ncbi:hypothetical protein B0H14DRAFT_2865665 [Mycena olivaceomarginata]|nr:hypothetical protein B0H14DRAFT_2865665 [Mycena olivaceomarginata]
MKKNKVECIQLVENIHQVLYAIINLHIKSDTPGSLPPSMLYHVGKFTETIHKVHTFLEAQQDGNRIKNLFRQSELNTLVKDCRAGLQHAMEVFKIESGASIYLNASIMQKTADNLHKELLEMISSLLDGTDMDKASSMHNTLNSSQMSSESFSMLPSKPKIFYGRESELASILKTLDQECARIIILGPAVLHHADVTAKYEHCFFVSCDSATTSIEIAALIGDHIGLKPGKDLTQPLLRYFAGQSTCLLILDNLETVWEPMGSRVGVEELLSLLTDIAHLALLITMRGAERPAKVCWTRPFLEPLKPLSDDAARQTFLDIADDFHEPKDIQSVLNLTNNMPLAVDLIAHLVDNEGCPSVLARWETEKTGLLSVGHDRRSNIDTSIRISLSSPRLTSSPGAMDLLRLLSVLPDGLSDIELLHSDLAIQDILTCKVVLLSTSLAYQDDKKQLKSLVPIREHMQHFHPPPSSLIQSLQKYFHTVLDLYEKYRGSQQMATSIHQIKSNFGNLNQILLRGLHADNTDTTGTIMCVLNLASFSRLTGREWLSLMDEIPNALPQPCNHKLEVRFMTEIISSSHRKTIDNLDVLVSQARSHFQHFNDPVLEALFYRALAHHYNTISNYAEAIPLAEKALSLVKTAGVTREQPRILNSLANLLIGTGEYISAQKLAIEAQMYARLSANLQEEAEGLRLEACYCREFGNYKHSAFLLQRGRELLRLCGLSGGNIDTIILSNEANTFDMKSEYNKAKLMHIQIAQTTSPTQDVINHAYALLNIADLDISIGGSQHDSGMVFCEIQMARLKLREGDTLSASRIFLKYLQWPWIGNLQISSHCLESLADIDSWAGINFHQKSIWTVVYLAHASKFHGKLALHKALLSLGKVFLADGDERTAENLFTVALDGFTFMDIHRSRADCMLCLGDIAKKQGHLVKASALWTDARPLFEQSLQAKDVSRIDSRLAKKI